MGSLGARLLLLVLGPALVALTVNPSTAAAATPLSISVAGNHLVNGDGTAIRLLGVNRSGTEYACIQGWGIFDGPNDAASVAAMAAWHINAVRIPLNEDCWLNINGVNPAYAGATYQSAIHAYINLLHQRGLYAILELHWNAPGTSQATGQQVMPDADHSPAFWTSVATFFKADPAVLFELYNEPHDVSWDVWRNGGPSGDGFQAVGMQQLYEAVRSTGADNLVVIGGLRYAFDLSMVGAAPIAGYNILYATHPYDQADKQAAAWDGSWGYLTARAPVVVTEFGSTTNCAGKYNSDVITYADTHGASWVGWAWFPQGCAFPSLIADWQGTPTTAGAPVRTALMTY